MIAFALHLLDLLLWLFMAGSVAYVCFFALASLLPGRRPHAAVRPSAAGAAAASRPHSFLVLFPAYHEDAVILHSAEEFLKQDYPSHLYDLVVISDHMSTQTNEQLRRLPLTLLTPQFEKSSKAKALQYAIHEAGRLRRQPDAPYDYVVILDADNVVGPDFLSKLHASCLQGYRAIQCHRCAKNSDNDIAVLDGVSEEINNTIFRRAHNNVGLSSALIGSGMCFDYALFRSNVDLLNTAVEDRELEALLLRQDVYIRYEQDIHVYDEKVSNKANFQRQRLRWMTGQIQSLLSMLPYIPKAVATFNVNYIDKTVQQALIPRSILIVVLTVLTLLMTVAAPGWSLKWWALFVAFAVALFVATPRPLRLRSLSRLLTLPSLVCSMLANLLRIDRRNDDFIHTQHG